MMDGEVYSPYLMVLTSAFVLYLVQRYACIQIKR
jgi:hypothetical protein